MLSAFYLIAGAAALQFHAWLNPGSITPTLGASGAVAALMGAFVTARVGRLTSRPPRRCGPTSTTSRPSMPREKSQAARSPAGAQIDVLSKLEHKTFWTFEKDEPRMKTVVLYSDVVKSINELRAELEVLKKKQSR